MFLMLLTASLAAPVPKEKKEDSYFPLTLGRKWVYEQRSGRLTTEYSEEVKKVEEKDGAVRVTVAFEVKGGGWDKEYVVKGGAVFQTKNGPHEFDPPVRQMELSLKPGAKWESKIPPTQGVWCPGGEMAAGEEEEVTVPAGMFKAIPVTYTITEVDGKPIAKPQVYTHWYVKGVGLVKMTFPSGEKVLKEFTPGK